MESAERKNVYVVDDDDAVRDSVRAVLESFGIDVRDFRSASDFLARVPQPAHGCLLLDLHMPHMGGLELLELIRQRGWNLPVIILTGRGDEQAKERALRAGVIALLDKPVEESTLMRALNWAFAR